MSIQIPMFIQVGEENPISQRKRLQWGGQPCDGVGTWRPDTEMCKVLGGGMAWLVVIEWKYNGGKTT